MQIVHCWFASTTIRINISINVEELAEVGLNYFTHYIYVIYAQEHGYCPDFVHFVMAPLLKDIKSKGKIMMLYMKFQSEKRQ